MPDFFSHTSVLLNESINGLAIKSNGIYIDATFGRGGHSRAILSRLGKHGRLYSIDRDYEAVLEGEKIDDPRFTMIHSPFSEMLNYAGYYNILKQVDGILLDLGVSSPQLDNSERGFSFMRDGPLDMRMDQTSGTPVSEWLLKANLNDIIWVIRKFGEERYACRIAKAIIRYRNDVKKEPLTRTSQLAQLISGVAKNFKKHPATRVFQAFRIYINNELEEIDSVLNQSIDILAPKGRLLVISFHSLEDRIVKHFMRKKSDFDRIPNQLPLTDNQIKKLSNLNLKIIGKPIKASQHEVMVNIRSRSAILRIAERL
ncbi:ribosomal RNA small subunit methyltransferase H [Candidatus Photodesmus katoptron]|uniref:Ribosomal RNA small subunit methyltransferase H n=1 Tax=Candidatus Photodesmus katoptron Akat1 TaxID=1236703 RepID=S3DJ56_9GAMM|nr:16S rRNA (cytosine(1402)-N(4))-methyltransferase RsmH [Candidatus Photodesmus katoptron]EPE37730.1 S-adenosyl-methyltransferase MraW [Candidatus Photodesmus katoptron Akat1]KEY90548.1 ribosomal RNA small subunit methyltransferase H [Candidatus Photodesmus katoptron]